VPRLAATAAAVVTELRKDETIFLQGKVNLSLARSIALLFFDDVIIVSSGLNSFSAVTN